MIEAWKPCTCDMWQHLLEGVNGSLQVGRALATAEQKHLRPNASEPFQVPTHLDSQLKVGVQRRSEHTRISTRLPVLEDRVVNVGWRAAAPPLHRPRGATYRMGSPVSDPIVHTGSIRGQQLGFDPMAQDQVCRVIRRVTAQPKSRVSNQD